MKKKKRKRRFVYRCRFGMRVELLTDGGKLRLQETTPSQVLDFFFSSETVTLCMSETLMESRGNSNNKLNGVISMCWKHGKSCFQHIYTRDERL